MHASRYIGDQRSRIEINPPSPPLALAVATRERSPIVGNRLR